MNLEQFFKWEAATRDTIDVKKIYIDMADDLVAGILLSQIVYWFLPSKNGKTKLRVKKDENLWLVKGREDWWDECRIKPRQYDTAIKKLIQNGLVETKIHKFNGDPKTHIRIIWESFMPALLSELNKSNENGETVDITGFNEIVNTDFQPKTLDTTGFNESVNSESQNSYFNLSEFVNSITESTNKDLKKNDDDEYIKSKSKNEFQIAFEGQAKELHMPDTEIEKISKKIKEQNIIFDILVLQKTLEIVLENYANTRYKITSLSSYFVKALQENQKRYDYARKIHELNQKIQISNQVPPEFVFYNWLEESI